MTTLTLLAQLTYSERLPNECAACAIRLGCLFVHKQARPDDMHIVSITRVMPLYEAE